MVKTRAANAGKPPYASWSVFEKVLTQIKKRQPTPLNLSVLEGWGISASNGKKCMPALKFLGIVNQDGTTNRERWTTLTRKGEAYQSAVGDIVRSAYKPLFDTYRDIRAATRSDIENTFGGKLWEVAPSSRSAAFQFFARLCAEGGIDLAEEATPPPQQDRLQTRRTAKVKMDDRGRAPRYKDPPPAGVPQLQLNVSFSLTGKESDQEVEELLAKLKRAYAKVFGTGS